MEHNVPADACWWTTLTQLVPIRHRGSGSIPDRQNLPAAPDLETRAGHHTMSFWKGLWLVLVLGHGVHAKTETFEWNDRLCHFVGEYDVAKVSRRQLQDCIRLMDNGENILDVPHVFDDITVNPKQEITWLDSAYNQRLKSYRNLNLPSREMKRIRKIRIEQLQWDYKNYRIMYLAFENPKILRASPYRDSVLDRHVNALLAGDRELMADWMAITESRLQSKCCQANAWQRVETRRKSKDSLAHARNDVVKKGWWGVVDHHVPRSRPEFDSDANMPTLQRLFVKLSPNACRPHAFHD